MRKLIKSAVLLTLFSATVLFTQRANANDEKVVCATIAIQCEGGGGTNFVTCGTPSQIAADTAYLIAHFCR